MRYRRSQEVLDEVRNITVSQSCGRWYASIQTQRAFEHLVHPSASAVGVARFATLSDDSCFAPLNSVKRLQAVLRKARHALSRKTKFSSNWKKAKARI
ncbi:transposase [Noviherbaspirillum malthae]|uniref:transposase n=1 Tax=Noviherbaspirillum malthae TaxID=1260987 RepID=UPI001890255D|nr:transposase [Noviherbaspirillum malthae]